MPHIGGIILCGGRSSRMGQPKLSLEFLGEPMLVRIARLLGEVVAPIVVVAAREQELPPLDSSIRIVRDEEPGLGPLAGIAVGLDAIKQDAEAAFITGCDYPLLHPGFVAEMISRLGEFDLAMPFEGEFPHPLAGVYRTSVANAARTLIAKGQMRPMSLVDEVDAVRVDVETLKTADPRLYSLKNVNTPEEFAEAVKIATSHGL